MLNRYIESQRNESDKDIIIKNLQNELERLKGFEELYLETSVENMALKQENEMLDKAHQKMALELLKDFEKDSGEYNQFDIASRLLRKIKTEKWTDDALVVSWILNTFQELNKNNFKKKL